MMAYLGEPLPYPIGQREEIEWQRRSELNAIIARHRMNFETSRLLAEAERLNQIKVSL